MIGEQAPESEAKIIVVAPHSSFFDNIMLHKIGRPSIIAKTSTQDIPFLARRW